jgi:hypothetical protein
VAGPAAGVEDLRAALDVRIALVGGELDRFGAAGGGEQRADEEQGGGGQAAAHRRRGSIGDVPAASLGLLLALTILAGCRDAPAFERAKDRRLTVVQTDYRYAPSGRAHPPGASR